ncbi:hypothetical protein [Nonomuraea endophytica]|uniref:Type II secretory pathway pseudopilin PulG n=1 Tax=Nonomuraea endophytica TaxID=714136 RepID=A0A7W8A0I6_9ACTN|nr:hypothetical protein [Nonomuraea endophytica]MBB5077302.1 type II secretory pathway pseudopilin PulG [Nonomuraea endophytica]
MTTDQETPAKAESEVEVETEAQAKVDSGFRMKIMGAVAAMLVAALAATAVLQWMSAGRAQDARAALEADRALRLEVSQAAHTFGQSLLSYDYQSLQATRTKLMAMATGDFLNTYDDAFGGVMEQVIVKLQAVSVATVRDVYLADVDQSSAHAIVVVDQQVTTAKAIRSVKDSHLKIALVREKGSWKVREVTVLGAAQENQYNKDGTPLADPSPTPTKKK